MVVLGHTGSLPSGMLTSMLSRKTRLAFCTSQYRSVHLPEIMVASVLQKSITMGFGVSVGDGVNVGDGVGVGDGLVAVADGVTGVVDGVMSVAVGISVNVGETV